MRQFSGLCLILVPYVYCLCSPICLYHPGTFHNQCIIQTSYVRKEWYFSHFHYFWMSFNHHLFSGTCLFLGFSIPLLILSPFIMFVGLVVHVHFPSVLCYGYQYLSWPSLAMSSFDFFTLQDDIFLFPQHNSFWVTFL